MEGTEEQLSGGCAYWELFVPSPELSLLYPELPEGYFADKEDALVQQKKDKPRVRPYIGRRDINNDRSRGEDNRPVPVWEIGVKVDF